MPQAAGRGAWLWLCLIVVGDLHLSRAQAQAQYPNVATDDACTIPIVNVNGSVQSGLFLGTSYLADSGARDMNVTKDCLNFAGRLAVLCQVDSLRAVGCCQPSCAQSYQAALSTPSNASCLDEVIAGFCRAQRNLTNVPANQWPGVMTVFLSTQNVQKRCISGADYNCEAILAIRTPPPASTSGPLMPPPPATSVIIAPSPTTAAPKTAPEPPQSSSNNIGVIVGASVGGAVVVAAAAVLAVIFVRRTKRKQLEHDVSPKEQDSGAAEEGAGGDGGAGGGPVVNEPAGDGWAKVEIITDNTAGAASAGAGITTAVRTTSTAATTGHMTTTAKSQPPGNSLVVLGTAVASSGQSSSYRGAPSLAMPFSGTGTESTTLQTPGSHSRHRGFGQGTSTQGTTTSTGMAGPGSRLSVVSRQTVSSGNSAFQKEMLSRMQITWDEIVLGRVVGRGGFGTVYKGVWQGNSVAVKMLDVEYLTDHTRESLRQEALAMSEIRHPSIATVYGLADDGERCALVMKFYEGGSLFNAMTKPRYHDMALYKRLRLALQIASGMQRLHQRNILHGDLKTANILLEKENSVVITDFGLSVMEGQSVASGALTVQISPPEVLANPKAPRTQAGDVYAFAIVLLETVVGRPVYGTASRALIKRAVMDGERPTIPQSVPQEVADIITQCWAQEAGDRPSFVNIVSDLTTLVLALSSKRREGEHQHEGQAGAWPTTAMASTTQHTRTHKNPHTETSTQFY